jgi:hypothetical protein
MTNTDRRLIYGANILTRAFFHANQDHDAMMFILDLRSDIARSMSSEAREYWFSCTDSTRSIFNQETVIMPFPESDVTMEAI